MEQIKLSEEYIKLGQALKAAGLVSSGVEAKIVIQDGLVYNASLTGFQEGFRLGLRLGLALPPPEDLQL